MATVTRHTLLRDALSRASHLGSIVAREAPFVPLLVLWLLASVAILAPVIAPHSKVDSVKPTRELCLARYGTAACPSVDNVPPFWSSEGHLVTPLGTDDQGRDVLSRLMYGARIALLVTLTGTLIAGAIGTWIGVLAGYMGGWWDRIIMRITDAWLALPSLILAIILAGVRGPGTWNVVLILALVFWGRYTRAVRGEVLAIRERDVVRLAENNGVSSCHIILHHIFPNVMMTVLVVFSLQIRMAVIIEASLSFLGLGVPSPEPSWGLMMAQARESLMEGKWWLAVFPGLCITMLVLSANMLGDWMRVRLDPQAPNR